MRRRSFLAQGLMTLASFEAFAKGRLPEPSPSPVYPISIFSKNLHWLGYEEMSSAAKQIGFEGIDLTVRPEGHVLPANVATDLPNAVGAIRKAGLDVWMITTAITSASDPDAEPILKTASALGIGFFRMGWISYDEKLSVEENLVSIGSKLSGVAELARKYKISAQYQNHAGTNFGAPVWDLAQVLNKIHSPWLGSQYDVLHATVEGANSWPLALQLIAPFVATMDIKDFKWIEENGKWKTQTVPLGEGLVDFKKYFGLLKKYKIAGPMSIHYEYPLGGAENGARILTMGKDDVLTAMQKDVVTLKRWLSEQGMR